MKSICFVEAVSLLNFGGGESGILLRSVECTGTERKLIDCPASSSSADFCLHAHDAGVRCQLGMFVFQIMQLI